MESDVIVSIECLTYNHEKYLAQALESFVSQITDFKYEILVHDDASTDRTPEILNEYAEKYPDLIKPYYEQTNQYSQGIERIARIQSSRINGKYVAFCEGDDYWTDPYKLQKQVDYLETHDDCTLVFHNAVVVDGNGNVFKDRFLPTNAFYSCYTKTESSKYSAEEMILLDFVPTNSLMYRACNIPDYLSFVEMRPRVCLDLLMRICHASKGYAYYFNETMSAYRTNISGSASRMAYQNDEALFKTINGHLEILDDFNKITGGKYAESIREAKDLKLFVYAYNLGCASICEKEKYRDYARRASTRDRAAYRIKASSLRCLYHIRKTLINRWNQRN